MNLAFIPYNTCYFHYRQIFFTIFEVSDMVTDKVSDIYCRYPASHKAITYWFSIIFLSDMLPTFISDIYIGITATITATITAKKKFAPTFTPTKQQ